MDPNAADPIVDPAAVAAADPVPAHVADPAVAPAADPVAVEPAPQPGAPAERTVPLSTMLDRVSRESRKRQEAETRAQAAEQRARELEARAAGDQGAPAADPAARAADPAPQPGDANFQAAVQRETARQTLYRDTVEVKNAGIAKFGAGFNESLQILTSLGATNDDFVLDVLAVNRGGAHELLQDLAMNPERAAALTDMDSRSRIAELTRLSMALKPVAAPAPAPVVPAPAAPAASAAAAPGAKTVSRAPAPAPALAPSASKIVDWRSDEASDEEFDKGFNETWGKRAARR